MKAGDTLAGRYELRARIGGGGIGEVFRGFDTRTQRDVAIKVFDPAACATPALMQYQAQVAAAMGVTHPGIVLPRVQVFVLMNPPFVVGEALDGHDLDGQRLAGPLSWPRAVAVAHACAEALAALAAATDAAHRALKPGNVWICPDGQVRVLDFGVAEFGARPVGARADGTAVEYRAPEQIAGDPGDARSDVFTLGVLLFEMITGVHPFAAASPAAAAERASSSPPPGSAQVAPSLALPAALETTLARMLARDPAQRFADAEALAGALVDLGRAAPVQAPTPAPIREFQADDLTTALSLPVVRRPQTPAPTPPPPPPAEPELDGPPLLSPAAEASLTAPVEPPPVSWLAAPMPAPAPLVEEPPMPAPRRPPSSAHARPRSVERDEPTETLPVVRPRDPMPDESTEALPVQPARVAAAAGPTEVLPHDVARRVAEHRPDESTAALAVASLQPAAAAATIPAPPTAVDAPVKRGAWIVLAVNVVLGLALLAALVWRFALR